MVNRNVNKLILIGNGFDLALGLLTGYKDFLFWYFKNVCKQLSSKSVHNVGPKGYTYFEDDIFLIYGKKDMYFGDSAVEKFDSIKDLNDIPILFEILNAYGLLSEYKSNLFKAIIKQSISGWVDIEKIFYDLLKKEIGKEDNSGVKKLNRELSVIKSCLKEYLSILDYTISQQRESARIYYRQFLSPVKISELIDLKSQHEIIGTSKIMFLNFNYTPTIINILQFIASETMGKFKSENILINYIHGEISKKESDLVFGYGDEMDRQYKDIEDLNDNTYLENFKSFKYNYSGNYRDLLRFLNSDDYQVCVYGHSCGLSDRVMLNEIFEHDNCKSIKIYYYDRNDFNNKNMEISRHFNSNKLMRQRIIEFSENEKIPQMSDYKR